MDRRIRYGNKIMKLEKNQIYMFFLLVAFSFIFLTLPRFVWYTLPRSAAVGMMCTLGLVTGQKPFIVILWNKAGSDLGFVCAEQGAPSPISFNHLQQPPQIYRHQLGAFDPFMYLILNMLKRAIFNNADMSL